MTDTITDVRNGSLDLDDLYVGQRFTSGTAPVDEQQIRRDSSMPTLKLTYFDFHGGRGEPARLALSTRASVEGLWT